MSQTSNQDHSNLINKNTTITTTAESELPTSEESLSILESIHQLQSTSINNNTSNNSNSSTPLQFTSTSLADSIHQLHSSLLSNSNSSDPNLDPFLASLHQLTSSSTSSSTLITTAPIDSSLPSLEIPTSEAEVHSQLFSLDFDHSSVLDDHQLRSLLFPDESDPQPQTQSTSSLPDPTFHPDILLSIPSQSPSATQPSAEFSNLQDSLKNSTTTTTTDTQTASRSQSIPLLDQSEAHQDLTQERLPTTTTTSTKQIKLPKAKLTQCNQLRETAEKALESVWEILGESGLEDQLEIDSSSTIELKITRGLDRQFGELHALSAPFKIEDLALIWPQCMTNKALKQSYHSGPSPAYFAIRKANIAFVIEYILYAMPGEEAYGKNDIVFACEGFLPLVLDRGLVQDEESWKLFNELKVQIYIQRLDQGGPEEANSRVLPNLFVESLSSYSGVEIEATVEAAFEAFANQTKAELVAAEADLDQLRKDHPYIPFAISALRLLRRCQKRLDEEQERWEEGLKLKTNRLMMITDGELSTVQDGQVDLSMNSKRKRKRKSNHRNPTLQRTDDKHSEVEERREMYEGMGDGSLLQEQGESQMGYTDHHGLHHDDINVGQHSRDDEDDPDGDPEGKGRYNPYRLGRGKGPAAAPRRRWTQEEYELLLEEVRLHSNKYDCMAQIIKRHGKHGEISDVLRDQNNVSLKDKARNLTMEWSRHGYPEDKPWLKEAFARFAVKPRSHGQPHHGRRIGIEEDINMNQEEEEVVEGEGEDQHGIRMGSGEMVLDPQMVLMDPISLPVKKKSKRKRRLPEDGLEEVGNQEILVSDGLIQVYGDRDRLEDRLEDRFEDDQDVERLFDPELLLGNTSNQLNLNQNQNLNQNLNQSQNGNGNLNDLLVIPVSLEIETDVPVDPSLIQL